MSIDPGSADTDEAAPSVPLALAAPAGFVLGDLQIGELLGRGATGEVRGAVGPDGETVAVKLLRPELADEPQVVARLLQECKLVARIADPHVVRIHRLIAEGDRVGIVMDHLPDGDLRALLRREGALPPADATRLAGQILLGLRRAHEAGVVHRDVKPENVLLRGRDAVLTDFGIARQLEGPALTRSTGLLGTPAYLAPELATHEPSTPAVDVYSAGCLLYELLTGSPPFVGGPAVTVLLRHLNEPPARPDGLADPLWDAVLAMLAKQPHLRPTAEHAAATLAVLAPTLAGLPARPWAPPAAAGTSGPTPRPDAKPEQNGKPEQNANPGQNANPERDAEPTPDLNATRTSGPRGPYALTGPVSPDPTGASRLALESGPESGAGTGESDDVFTTRTSAPRSSSWRLGQPIPPGPNQAGRAGRWFPRRAAVLIPVVVVLVLALVGTGLAAVLRHGQQADLAGDTSGIAASSSVGAAGAGASGGPSTSPTTPSAATSDDGNGSATAAPSPTPTGPGAGFGSRATTARTPAAPSVPAPARPSVTAAPRSGVVLLTINQPSGGEVTGYRISGDGAAGRSVPPARQVTVAVPDCDTHTFVVTAVGPGGSADSAAVNAVGCVPPGPVTGVVATVDQLAGNGSGTVTVRWSAPADRGGAGSVDYVVTITRDNPNYPPYTVTTTGTVYTHCMPAGRCPEYVTAIQARNSVGLGPKVPVPNY
ncbi:MULTISPECIES: serine/threonine-protein kinase [Pseudofrankia]|uniref:serine/threonine-protein kinase n=1 Tax=Pseudofrankia TaxID=2994363 RepID=UPI000234D36C|nr:MULTISPECIES: serine/threonine-protein kinase [Pseudofrankia]OHV31659.1 hypothetical protein BCD49_31195 [Pseudofrankia sp. EUN1h]